jgi:TonB family protein
MNTTLIAPGQSSLQRGISTGMENPTPKKRVVLPPATGKPGTTARFALLPEGKSRFGSLGTSVIVQICVVAVMIIIPLAFPEKMIPKMIFEVTPLAVPVTELPPPPPPAPKVAAVKPKPVPEPEPVKEVAVVEPVRQPKVIAPKVVAPKVQPKPVVPTDAPKIEAKIETPDLKLDNRPAEPARPRAPIQTGMIGTGSSAAATLPSSTPLNKVQTGGFGDPNGVAGPGDPNKRQNVNGRGSMDLPPGPGYGNGTGGANGARGTVASAGFGNGTAIPPPGGNGGGGHRTIQQSGITAEVVEAEKPKQQNTQAAAVQPIEITEKPKPEYTPEARALKLEGQVVVAVIFKATGEIVVQNVVQGLGHGLDEMAVKAAQHIKYKPAISNGQPVDFPARVRIEFQLAY